VDEENNWKKLLADYELAEKWVESTEVWKEFERRIDKAYDEYKQRKAKP
jgi:hypothetical protein